VTFVQGNQHLLAGFSHGLDTFGAEYFVYLAALFHHQCLLQVRFELTIGGSLREGTGVPKGCGLPTLCAFSHVRETSFLAIIPKFNAFCKGRAFYHRKLPRSRTVSFPKPQREVTSNLVRLMMVILDQHIPSDMEGKVLPIFKG
jgi:hypothetical protein